MIEHITTSVEPLVVLGRELQYDDSKAIAMYHDTRDESVLRVSARQYSDGEWSVLVNYDFICIISGNGDTLAEAEMEARDQLVELGRAVEELR